MGREAFRPVTRSMVARTVAGVPGYNPARSDGTRRGGQTVTLPDGRTFSLRDMATAQQWESHERRRELERAGQLRLPGTDLCPKCAELMEPLLGLAMCLACARAWCAAEEKLLLDFIRETGIVPGPLWGRQGGWCPECYEDMRGGVNRTIARQDDRCPECAIAGRRNQPQPTETTDAQPDSPW